MIEKIIQRLNKIDEKILKERTGTPQVLANTIGVSERTIYEYLTLMRKLGAPIEFRGGNYRYTKPGGFRIGFEEVEPAKEKHVLNQVYGDND
jgi:predicted DNA-binding transcriptional regulator YafY